MATKSNRRRFLGKASLLMAGPSVGSLLVAPRAALAAETGSVTAETAYGRIRGTLVEDVKIFKGIPYGENTSGSNRFRPPLKPAKWSGVRDAIAYGPIAPQTLINSGGRPINPPSLSPVARQTADEDCLVLNVFTPSVNRGRRPVMVWLHGGGFSAGSGSGPDGTPASPILMTSWWSPSTTG